MLLILAMLQLQTLEQPNPTEECRRQRRRCGDSRVWTNGATGLGLPSLVLTAQLELNQEQEEGILQESGAKSGADFKEPNQRE